MFNELTITEIKDSYLEKASWDEKGNITIDMINLTKSWSYKRNDKGRERTMEEIIHFINKEFLIEFICMEIAKGDVDNPKCDKILWHCCTPRMTAKEMLRPDNKIRTCDYCNKELTFLEYKSGSCKCEDY